MQIENPPNLVDQLTVDDRPRLVRSSRSAGDRMFRGAATGGGALTLVLLALIGTFLIIQAIPAFKINGWQFLTRFEWNPEDAAAHHQSGVGAIMYWTMVIAVIAMVIATPIAVFAAIFLTEYAPLRMRKPLTSAVDLMAAVPAVIFGIWGFFFLQPRLLAVAHFLTKNFGFIPFFKTTTTNYASSAFIAGTLVGLMLLPTATSVMREVFSQAPPGEKEAALALGGSRWRMIRNVVIPFGRGGIVGGSMLGLGRALGEAIAIALIINPIFLVNPYILQSGTNSVGAMIANRFSDSSTAYGIPALMGAAVVLFFTTLLVNTGASLVVRRSRSGAGVEI